MTSWTKPKLVLGIMTLATLASLFLIQITSAQTAHPIISTGNYKYLTSSTTLQQTVALLLGKLDSIQHDINQLKDQCSKR